MANEILMTAKLAFDKGLVVGVSRDESDKNVTVTGARYSQVVQNVGFAAEEAMEMGDVGAANAGYCHIKNLDSTNFITYGPLATETHLGRLNAGESALLRLNKAAATAVIQANTAACDVEILVVED